MQPETEAELAAMIRDTDTPLRLRGGGTRPVGRPGLGEALSLGAMSGVELYEPGSLTLVARAGTPLAEVEALLAQAGQRLPFEPMDHRGLLATHGTPTMGGMVAANASGPRRIQAGACRDSLIGVRFVDGTGAILKNGGRVMKNVTGYDLVKLMAGSWGTLGVLTEVAFKVLPVPECQATLVVHGLTPAQAVEAMAAALGSPYEVSGAAHGSGETWLRIEGFAPSVAYRAQALRKVLGRFGALSELGLEDSARIWRDIRDVAVFHGTAGDVWRISVKPSDAPEVLDRLGEDALLDWGGGLIWLHLAPGTDARAALSGISGHATLMRADAATRTALPAFAPEAPAVAALTAGLRRRFDPRGILNPGLME
ncbi:glycolate oxidase subunit GlcE [Roseicitreum antarcticum]|uniref:Glycolate oxidase FAD binding subunit n=1 Tax=Roseicitreum antarcticum TaxID=564137 RepID=A0A1H3BV76_9RHOB|nr:glycolate oxidase subunit GlcE [Roseicitreum antarcticum]SDX45069.1 glycolate oxidase FAD binding subunit [Roseicitreum antarcticum]